MATENDEHKLCAKACEKALESNLEKRSDMIAEASLKIAAVSASGKLSSDASSNSVSRGGKSASLSCLKECTELEYGTNGLEGDNDAISESSRNSESNCKNSIDEKDSEEEGEELLYYENDGETKEDDDRVAREVEEHRSYARSIMNSARSIAPAVSEEFPQEKRGSLQMILEHGDLYGKYLLSRGRCESQEIKKGGRGSDRHLVCAGDDDAEMLKAAVDETSGRRLFTRLTTQPSILRGQAKAYQMEGLNWLINLYESGLNGILADEMGLGKTFMTISLLAYLKESRKIRGPHLVLAPKSTLGNWINEFHRFCPSINAFKLLGTKQERAEMKIKDLVPGRHDVIVCSYEMCCKEKAALKKFKWRYIIIDEAHRIKNELSKLSATVREFRAQFRLLLTGTPLQNNLKELWALLNFLFPEIFSSAEEFEQIFDLTGSSMSDDLSRDDREAKNMSIVTRLHKLLKPFLLRRVKKEVMSEMPPKKEFWLFVSLTELQTKLYKDILSRSVNVLQGGEGSSRTQLLNVAMQLRKASNHPYLFEGYEDKNADPFGDHVINNAGKLRLMDKLMHRLIDRGSRTLIFSQMTRMIDILEDYCRIRQISYFRIDGNTSGEERDRQIEEFNSPGSTVTAFLLSTRAGGLGINLATADTVILYDSDWNPQVDLQAMDRAHRIGQKNPVNVYRLIHEGTIEEMILEKALLKLQLDSAVIQHGRLTDKQKQLTKSELTTMVQYGADHIFKSENNEITETELDAILARGEERSEILNSKLQEHVKKSILDFSVNPNTNLYEYDGINYNQEQRRADRQSWVAMAVNSLEMRDEREARRRVRLLKEQDFQVASRSNRGVPRLTRLPPMHEWQFYDKARILKLHEAEVEFYKHNGSNEKFTGSEFEEKKRLLQEGFKDWSKRDFQSFIRGCELHGRENIEGVASEIEGKTVEEVRQYSKVFWERYKELTISEKCLKKVKLGESAIQKRRATEEIILKKQKHYKYPWKELATNFPGHKAKTFFTETEDRWVLNMIPLLGYGQWDKLKSLISRSPHWRFDWMIRSRPASELGRRADALIRIVKKEEGEKQTRCKRSIEAANSSEPHSNTHTSADVVADAEARADSDLVEQGTIPEHSGSTDMVASNDNVQATKGKRRKRLKQDLVSA